MRACFAWLGLITLVLASALIDDTWIYPGFLALVPVAATVALIAGGNTTSFAPVCVLGTKPLQVIGDASYSIYLWHFPMMVLFETLWPDVALIPVPCLGRVAASSHGGLPICRVSDTRRCTATSPYRPRSGNSRLRRRCLEFIVLGRVLDNRSPELARLVTAARGDVPNLNGCQLGLKNSKLETCTFATIGSGRRVVLFGDSYAGHLFEGVRDAAVATGWQLKVRVKASCPPLDAFTYSSELRAPDVTCMEWREAVVAELLSEKPDLVFISSRTGISRGMHDQLTGKRLPQQKSEDVWRLGFRKLLTRISDAEIRVVVVRSTPRARSSVLDCLASDLAELCNRPRSDATNLGVIALDVARQGFRVSTSSI